ncbi:coiled-coil domain-containing protein 106-like [Misgurnus anguillicaudatus]
MTTPEQVTHRYLQILTTFRKTKSIPESLKKHKVDKTTLALTNIIAEVAIASDGEDFTVPPYTAGTTLQSYAKDLLKFLSSCPQLKSKIEKMKAANKLLPIKNKFRG